MLRSFLVTVGFPCIYSHLPLLTRKKIFIGSYSGLIQIWDYENRVVIASRKFERGAMIQCVDIDPKGYFIGMSQEL